MADIEENKVLAFSELLSGPLISTLEADFATAKRFVDFMQECGIEENPEDPEGSARLKMLTFVYSQVNRQTGENEEFRVEIPVLSLIPLPLLQIEQAKFDFNIRVYSEVEYRSAAAEKGALTEGVESVEKRKKRPQTGQFKGFKARLSPTVGRTESGEGSTTLDANMKVTVAMRQADLPVGLAHLMNFFHTMPSVSKLPPASEEEAPSSQGQQPPGTSPPTTEI